ncbi:MAG TPA: SRPBCC family protein [Kofleriaceae bacterium]|nr:SRPBCC family protein [Kofleriaceae bacterium]
MKSVSAFRSPAREDQHDRFATKLSAGLGWFSLALGTAQLAVPRTLSRLIGIEPSIAASTILRGLGIREIASGLGLLLEPRRPVPLWARVAGDVIDLGLLGIAASSHRTNRVRLAGAMASVAGVMALDVIAARGTQRHFEAANRPVIYSVTINRPVQEVYQAFRDFSRFPQFMDYLASVQELDRVRSRWVAKLPIGGTVEWDAEITDEMPNQRIAWQSVEGSRIKTRGSVIFSTAPSRNSTEVRVEMQLGFTGKAPSTLLAKFFAKPQIKGDLRRFKQLVETGEVLFSDATEFRRPHPAQPPEQVQRRPKIFEPRRPTAEKGARP